MIRFNKQIRGMEWCSVFKTKERTHMWAVWRGNILNNDVEALHRGGVARCEKLARGRAVGVSVGAGIWWHDRSFFSFFFFPCPPFSFFPLSSPILPLYLFTPLWFWLWAWGEPLQEIWRLERERRKWKEGVWREREKKMKRGKKLERFIFSEDGVIYDNSSSYRQRTY